MNNIHEYKAWEQYSHIDTGKGYIKFHRRGGNPDITFNLSSSNGLWFHTRIHNTSDYCAWHSKPTIHRMNQAAEYTLYHLRYSCAGRRNLSIVHMHVDNQTKLQEHCFFKCLTCMLATGDKRAITHDDNVHTAEFDDWFDNTKDHEAVHCDPGQHFHVEFGFMKGSGYCRKDEEGRTITSIDGFRSYFLIIDKKTRYVWVYLTKAKNHH
jgi:hypothetical protein